MSLGKSQTRKAPRFYSLIGNSFSQTLFSIPPLYFLPFFLLPAKPATSRASRSLSFVFSDFFGLAAAAVASAFFFFSPLGLLGSKSFRWTGKHAAGSVLGGCFACTCCHSRGGRDEIMNVCRHNSHLNAAASCLMPREQRVKRRTAKDTDSLNPSTRFSHKIEISGTRRRITPSKNLLCFCGGSLAFFVRLASVFLISQLCLLFLLDVRPLSHLLFFFHSDHFDSRRDGVSRWRVKLSLSPTASSLTPRGGNSRNAVRI